MYIYNVYTFSVSVYVVMYTVHVHCICTLNIYTAHLEYTYTVHIHCTNTVNIIKKLYSVHIQCTNTVNIITNYTVYICRVFIQCSNILCINIQLNMHSLSAQNFLTKTKHVTLHKSQHQHHNIE